MPSIKAIFMAMAIAFTTANAHMIMATPVPYGSPNNSPLKADGSDFPCKISTNAGATVNKITIGTPQELSFNGTAVHGGGSCQISLTKDMPATKASTWQVIHSIEGGCPAKNVSGNLPTATGTGDPDKYYFTIPDGIAPGAYTLGWTWFNKVGNREMYMNCASVDISGGSKKREVYHPHATETYPIPELTERDTSFPDLFVANIPATNCVTKESVDLLFPNPGSSVEKDGSDPSPSGLQPPTGPKCSAGPAAAGGAGGASASTGGGSSGSGSSGAGAGSGSGAASSAAAVPSGAAADNSGSSTGAKGASGSASGANSGMYSVGSGSGSGAASPALAAPSGIAAAVVSAAAGPSAASGSAPYANSSAGGASSPAAASNPAATAPSSGASTSGSTSGTAAAPATGSSSTGTCTTAGASICSPDGKQIGTCTSGMTVTWMPVADGTKCSGGMMVMAGTRKMKTRGARFFGLGF